MYGHLYRAILAVVLATILPSCSQTSEAIDSASQRWLKAQADRDATTLWQMLAGEDKDRIQSFYDALQRLDEKVKTHYPEGQYEAIRSSLGTDALDDCKDAAAMFTFLVTQAGDPQVLSTFQKLGLRAVQAVDSENGYRVQTLGGDELRFIDEDGEKRVRLSEEDALRLKSLQTSVQQHRQSLDDQVRAKEKRRL